ncbi:MAG: anion permease [Lachnospiraceae bacterium]|nr:anion permease [Lachnospiraceae bacterium]
MIFARIVAIVIFILMFALIIMDRIPKQYVTLGAGLGTMVFVFGIGGVVAGNKLNGTMAAMSTLNIRSIFTTDFWYVTKEASEVATGISWSTIFFLAGMMVMVEGMARTGFFRWLCMLIAKAVKYKTTAIFVTFMLMSFVLAMFIDSITVILFLAAVTIELSQLLKFNPVPMIMSEVFCANLGGSATMCGDPPNIIIGTAFGHSFVDFLTNTGLIALVSLVVVVVYFFIMEHKELGKASGSVDIAGMPTPSSAILDRVGFGISCVIFAIAVVLLITHAMTGLTVATIGIGIAVITLVTTFMVAGVKGLKQIFKGVDYETLLFFVGLFIVVGGLEETDILKLIATFIEHVSGGNHYLMIAIIIWVSAIASAFIDNIPFAATMVPVISSLSVSTGVPLATLSWALAMGTDIGGSATPIGASANVVGCATSTKAGHPITWGTYCKKNVPATILVLIISTVMIFVRYL